jgi:hypothetical protein
MPRKSADPELRDFADATGLVYANRNPGINPVEVLKHVERQVKQKFPEKFGAVRKGAPNPTLNADKTKTKPASKKDDVDLDDTEQAIMQNLVRQGVMTEAEYKAELKKVKGL